MDKFQPNYSTCSDERKEVHGNICKHIRKDIKMFCGLKKEYLCPSWKGYKHGML